MNLFLICKHLKFIWQSCKNFHCCLLKSCVFLSSKMGSINRILIGFAEQNIWKRGHRYKAFLFVKWLYTEEPIKGEK